MFNQSMLDHFDTLYFERFKSEGWIEKDGIMTKEGETFRVNLNYYPIVQVFEEGEEMKSFHRLSGAVLTLNRM